MRPSQHRHDVPDDLSQRATERTVRRSPCEWVLRGASRQAVYLDAGLEPLARNAGVRERYLARARPREPAAQRQLGVDQPLASREPASAYRLATMNTGSRLE